MAAELNLDNCVNTHCPWSVKPVQADSLTHFDGMVVGFCNPGCRDKFDANPNAYPEAKGTFYAAELAQRRRAMGKPAWHIENSAIEAELNNSPFPFVYLHANKGITAEVYAPKGEDKQHPHNRDEFYMIKTGTAEFECDGKRVNVATGDFLYVPAFMDHRFHNMSNDFSTWVIFWGDPKRG